MPQQHSYTIDDLIETYSATMRPQHEDFRHYSIQLLEALQKAFEVTINDWEGVPSSKRPIWMLFRATIESHIAIRTPGSNFSDSSLILKRLESSPLNAEVSQHLISINTLTEENIKHHRALIDILFAYLYQPKASSVTSQDLYKIGFDDSTEPNPNDYEY